MAISGVSDEPTFVKDIGPIMIAKCAPCHRSGGPAPFSLQSFQDAEKRANQIAIAAINRKMPPNQATTEFGSFGNQETLTADEIVLIQRWASGSKARGDGAEPTALPAAPGWPLGAPDAILKSDESYTIQPDDVPHWRSFRIPISNLGARKVRGFDIKPLSPNAIRYVELALDNPVATRTAGLGSIRSDRILCTWSYGNRAAILPNDASIDLSSARHLIAHVLVIPSGRLQTADFEIGLYFGDGLYEPQTLAIGLAGGVIPPSPAYTATATLRLPLDARILAVFPQCRDLASEILLIAKMPDGRNVTLFHYDGYNPLWVGSYRFERPFAAPAGTALIASIRYDNSTHSTRNRDRPPTRVPIGVAEGEEPCRIGVQLLIP